MATASGCERGDNGHLQHLLEPRAWLSDRPHHGTRASTNAGPAAPPTSDLPVASTLTTITRARLPMHTLVASGAAPARSVRGFEHQMVDEPDTAFTTTGHVAAEPAGALASVPGGRPPKQQRRSRGCWGDFAEVFWDGMRGSRVSQSRSNAARMASVRSASWASRSRPICSPMTATGMVVM